MGYRSRPPQGPSSEDDCYARSYLARLGNPGSLSRQRERELAVRVKAGDLAARDELVVANLRQVFDLAWRYRNQGMPLADLVAAGNFGLVVAASRFDPERQEDFAAYAFWQIRYMLCQALQEQGRTIRIPPEKLALLDQIALVAENLTDTWRREPTPAEIAAALPLSPGKVSEALSFGQVACSLDDPPAPGNALPKALTLPENSCDQPDARLRYQEAGGRLRRALAALDMQEMQVISLFFGLDDQGPQTWDEISRQTCLSRERAQGLLQLGLLKLRRSGEGCGLRELVGEFEGRGGLGE